jgi:chromosome segregation ATPase
VGEKDITLTSQRSEISYLKKEIDDLHEAISRYNNEIVYLKSNLDNNKTSFVSGMENVVGEKEDFIGRLRRDLANKDARIHELEEQTSQLQESIRKLKRDLTQMELLREEFQQL